MYQTLDNFLVKTSGLNLVEDNELNNGINSVKTLMLLHGWGMNSQVWGPIRADLESRYHIIWVDLPGHGFNRQVKAQSFEHMVDLISELTPANTHLIGWSLGGLVAQSLAQKNPDKIKSSTLVASTPRFSQGANGDWPNAMSEIVLNRFAENLKKDSEKTLKGFIALQFIGVENAKQAQDKLINQLLYNGEGDGKTPKKVGGVFFNDGLDKELNKELGLKEEQNNIPTEEALDVGLDILKRVDLRNVMPTCPQHWIFGEYDRLIPREVINDLISLRPDAEITQLDKAGHAPFITQSDLFLSHITRFIEALE